MARARFNVDGATVTLIAEDPFTGLRIQRTFHVPNRPEGGYVREDDRQVCVGLSSDGATLRATREELAHVIRKNWRRYCASAKKGWG